MDGDRFDRIARRAADATSRRRLLTLLTGGGATLLGRRAPDTLAACGRLGQRCRRRRDCCAGGRCVNDRCRCKPGRADCNDDGKCEVNLRADSDNCGACGRACRADRGETCVAGECVGGDAGTCRDGDDVCLGNETTPYCNSQPSCHCMTSMAGNQTHCARLVSCSPCASDADCALSGPNAFCVRKTGTGCCTNLAVDQGYCARVCD